MVWVSLYPLLLLATVTVMPRLAAYPSPLRALLLSGLLVGLTSFVVAPVVARVLGPWLRR